MHGLILGSGMYVTGRGTEGPGTLLAALLECGRHYPISALTVVARSPAGADDVARCMAQLEALAIRGAPVTHKSTGDMSIVEAVETLCQAETYDFSVLCLPDHLHFETLKALIARGIPTLVVKPLVATIAEADELLEMQRNTGVYCAVEFHKRWDESNLYAKHLIDQGKLGELSYVGVDYSQRISIPSETFAAWSTRTSIFQYLGVHYVDLVHFLTRAMPIRLSAYGTKGILKRRGLDTYDSIHCTIEWNRIGWTFPFVSTLNIGWIDPDTSTALSNQRIYLVGSGGRLDCDQKHRGVEWVEHGRPSMQVNPYFSLVLPVIGGNQYRGYALESVRCFVADIASLRAGTVTIEKLNQSERPTLSSSRVSTAVIEATHLSLSNKNTWIDIDAYTRA